MVELECVMDYSSEFTTYEIFKSREALCKWTREVGKRNGLVVVIKKSDMGGNGRRPRILFGCERGGYHRSTSKNIEAQSEKRPKRQSGTKKCGCPFALKGQKLSNDDDWMLEVVCGVHNHPAAEHLEGHSYAGRLSQDETSLLVDMSKSMVRPKEILVTLKQKDALNATTMKTIYNARHRHKVTKKVGRPQKQHLMDISGKIEKMVRDGDKHVTRVLFCGPHFPASQNYTREYLQNYPFIQVDDVPLGDVPDVIANYHICIVKSMKLDSNIISRANQMKLIMQYGVGLEGVDIDAATKCGIKIARIPSDITGNAASCAEMAIYLILGLLRKQNEMQIAVRQKKLGEPVGETLLGKTVFILGFGNIGIELAKRLRPFGVRIIATKRNWASHSQYSCQSEAFPIQNGIIADLVDGKGGQEDLYEFASKADIVVCCLRMNSETAGIVNKRFISSMKKGALLVNIARGGLLDYEAVTCHLESGHLGGLGIDVAWTEPFDPDDPILKFQNVLITPHVAGVTEFSYRSMSKIVGDVALQLHGGTPLTGIEFVN